MLFSEAINRTLDDAMKDPDVLLCGQLVNYGHSLLTRGLEKKYPKQVITYPVSENLMNSSAMGLSLTGKRPVMIHERFDFAMVGMDALVNHIPIWQKKCRVNLPLVIMAIVGHGRGQGPQQNKDFSDFFRSIFGWSVFEPKDAESAGVLLKEAIFGEHPVMYVVHRELY